MDIGQALFMLYVIGALLVYDTRRENGDARWRNAGLALAWPFILLLSRRWR